MWSNILKIQKIKVIGSIFKKLLLEHVEETDYQDEYIIEDVIENIFDEYEKLHRETGKRFSKYRIEEKMNMFFTRSFPEGYKRVGPLMSERKPSRMVKLNQQNNLEKGRRRTKIIGSIFKKLLLEHVEKTGYKNEYIIGNVIDSIINEYKKLHAQTGKPIFSISHTKEKMNQFFSNSFPEGYKKVAENRSVGNPLPSMMVKLDQQNNLEKEQRRARVIGSIFKKLLLEHVEKTSYQDEYIIEDVIENIFDEYKKLHRQAGEGIFSISHLKEKMNIFIGASFPEGYERKQGYRQFPSKMIKQNQQKDLEKLKTSSGEYLKLRDWENFKSRLRRNLRAEVPLDKYGRRTNVRLVDGEDRDGKIALNVSFRAKNLSRKYVHVFFKEQGGDYVFTTVEGDIQLSDNEVFDSESELRNRITDMVIELVEQDYEERDLREKGEEELTEEENIRQLEAANPDSQWDREKAKLVPREIPIKEQESRDLNLREAAEFGSKMKEAEEKKRKLLEAQKRLKDKSGKLKPVRGKRGRRDVS